jgi:two-component system phosphate regulon sensor histidine kinase PhoR
MFWRLFGSFSILLLGAIAVLGVVIVSRVERHFLQQAEESLRNKAVLLREALVGAGEPLASRVERLRSQTGTRITLIAEDGTVLAESDRDPTELDNHLDRPEIQMARVAPYGISRRRHSSTVDQDMMYVALRTERDPIAYVRVALPLDQVHEQLAGLRHLIWTAVIVTACAALALTFWLARHSTRPLQ